jgi:AcrR family transcriptional regulator
MPAKNRARRRVVPQQPRAQASVEAILTAAQLLLDEVGYERATTNRIAERAGVNVALLYRYFAGKESIVGALIERAAIATELALGDAIERTRGQPFAAGLRAIVISLTATPSPNLHRALVEHVGAAERGPLLDALRARLLQRFDGFLARHADELRAARDREAALFILGHALEAVTHAVAFHRPPSLSADRAIDATVELVSRYLMRAT